MPHVGGETTAFAFTATVVPVKGSPSNSTTRIR